jgi:hypothetical protein
LFLFFFFKDGEEETEIVTKEEHFPLLAHFIAGYLSLLCGVIIFEALFWKYVFVFYNVIFFFFSFARCKNLIKHLYHL